jgi:hypothetical protein
VTSIGHGQGASNIRLPRGSGRCRSPRRTDEAHGSGSAEPCPRSMERRVALGAPALSEARSAECNAALRRGRCWTGPEMPVPGPVRRCRCPDRCEDAGAWVGDAQGAPQRGRGAVPRSMERRVALGAAALSDARSAECNSALRRGRWWTGPERPVVDRSGEAGGGPVRRGRCLDRCGDAGARAGDGQGARQRGRRAVSPVPGAPSCQRRSKIAHLWRLKIAHFRRSKIAHSGFLNLVMRPDCADAGTP